MTLAGGAALAAVQTRAQTTIVDWNFDALGTQAAPYNSPAPSTGSGTATVLGMNNNYNDGTMPSLPFADVLATAGASTGSGSFAWRIRGGNTVAGTPNGWSTNAPIATQGASFASSTAGYSNIKVTFDLYTTSQAEANVAFLYTTDGTTWTPAAMTYTGGFATQSQNNSSSPLTITGPYLQLKQSGGGWYNQIGVDLSSVAAANNDPNFALEIVNASTSTDNINQTGGIYNNSSGNWRYDNVEVTGTAPEPSTLAMVGFGLAGLVGVRRFRKQA